MADIRMSEEQFAAAIKAAAEAAVSAVLAGQPAPSAPLPNRGPMNIEEFPGQYASIMREARQRVAVGDPDPVPCRGEMGATFLAQIDKRGIIVALLEYKEPPQSQIYENAGGHVPNGSSIYEDAGGRQVLSVHYKQWRYETYWLADLRYFVGKPIAQRKHLTIKPAPVDEAAAE
jgi:hypothetical protein